jgi:hypothetical protein
LYGISDSLSRIKTALPIFSFPGKRTTGASGLKNLPPALGGKFPTQSLSAIVKSKIGQALIIAGESCEQSDLKFHINSFLPDADDAAEKRKRERLCPLSHLNDVLLARCYQLNTLSRSSSFSGNVTLSGARGSIVMMRIAGPVGCKACTLVEIALHSMEDDLFDLR